METNAQDQHSFSGMFLLSGANRRHAYCPQKSCLVYHYLSNICRYSMYPLVQDTFRALFWCRHTVEGTLCALINKNKAHRLRFWQNNRGAFSTVQRWERKMLNLHCFQFYESNVELCFIFDNVKPFYFFFFFFFCAGKLHRRFLGNRKKVSTPAGSINVFLLH